MNLVASVPSARAIRVLVILIASSMLSPEGKFAFLPVARGNYSCLQKWQAFLLFGSLAGCRSQKDIYQLANLASGASRLRLWVLTVVIVKASRQSLCPFGTSHTWQLTIRAPPQCRTSELHSYQPAPEYKRELTSADHINRHCRRHLVKSRKSIAPSQML